MFKTITVPATDLNKFKKIMMKTTPHVKMCGMIGYLIIVINPKKAAGCVIEKTMSLFKTSTTNNY